MDTVAVRIAIRRALSARESVEAANKMCQEARQMQEQAQREYKAAVGQLGTILGPHAIPGVVYEGLLVRVDPTSFHDPFIVCPVIPAGDVSEAVGPVKPEASANGKMIEVKPADAKAETTSIDVTNFESAPGGNPPLPAWAKGEKAQRNK